MPSPIFASEVFDVLDQCPLIFVAEVVAVVTTLVLDEVWTRAHFQEPLQQGRLPCRVVDGLQTAELRFLLAGQNSIDVSQKNGFHVLRMHVRQEIDRRPLRYAHQLSVKLERGQLGIKRLQEREQVWKAAIFSLSSGIKLTTALPLYAGQVYPQA
jgi:hypothetical protein